MEGSLYPENELYLVESPLYKLDNSGNVVLDENIKMYLGSVPYSQNPLSKKYWNIVDLGNDFYCVCDVCVLNGNLRYIDEYSYYEIEKYEPEYSFKLGVIKLKRNKRKQIIPMAEELVVPIIYDRIVDGGENTLIAYSNGKLTYIDLDPQSLNYGKQLVPVCLDHAVEFDVDYEGFAECSINGIVGYIPRNIKPMQSLSEYDLLSEEQVCNIVNQKKEQEKIYRKTL